MYTSSYSVASSRTLSGMRLGSQRRLKNSVIRPSSLLSACRVYRCTGSIFASEVAPALGCRFSSFSSRAVTVFVPFGKEYRVSVGGPFRLSPDINKELRTPSRAYSDTDKPVCLCVGMLTFILRPHFVNDWSVEQVCGGT